MKKNIILWMAASAVVMLAFPWLAVTFVKGDAGMAVCFLLVFCCQSIIFRANRSICGKRCEAFVEPSGYFSSTISDRNMDIL